MEIDGEEYIEIEEFEYNTIENSPENSLIEMVQWKRNRCVAVTRYFKLNTQSKPKN